MAERAKLWVYFVFGVAFTLIYSVTSHWIWHSGGWLFGLGMQDFPGSTVVHYQGALAALAGAILLARRIGKFGHDGRANPIPGHNMPYAVLGRSRWTGAPASRGRSRRLCSRWPRSPRPWPPAGAASCTQARSTRWASGRSRWSRLAASPSPPRSAASGRRSGDGGFASRSTSW